MKKLLFLLLAIFLLAAGCGKPSSTAQNNQPTPAASPTPTVTPSPIPSITSNGKIFETDYFKVTIPEGWTAKAANRKVYTGNCNNVLNCRPTYTNEPDRASVNITKGNFILFINSRAGQASGVMGGRFSEIASGAPSVDAIVTEQPSQECGESEKTPAIVNNENNFRVDLYDSSVNNANAVWCKSPTNGKTVWYFSYITGSEGGYFNYFNVPEYSPGTGWAVTMAYNGKTVNSFPEKGNGVLIQALSDMTDMLKTLTIKFPVVYAPEAAKSIKNIGNTYWSVSYEEGLNSNFVSCTDTANTSNIKKDSIKSSYNMETGSVDGKVSFTETDVTSRLEATVSILSKNGWSKCNSVTKHNPPGSGLQTTDVIDVYKLGNEVVNVDSNSFKAVSGGMNYNLFLTFIKLK